MKILQEVTDWQDYPVANHVYFTDDSRGKIYAYIKQGTDNVFEFAAPIKFDVRGRKFKTVDVNIWNFIPRGDAQPEDKTWQVPGSKEVYTVTKDYTGKISCSCPGFKYRGDCKHVKLDFIVGQIK